MAIEKTITLYTFEELSERAKENARDWWKSCRDASDFEYVVEDFQRVAELLGFRLKDHPVKLMNGNTRSDPSVYWSLGYSQSDYAGFDAYYAHNKGSVAAIKAYAPKDERLHAIATSLVEAQRKHRFALEATIKHSSYYGMEVADTTVDGRYLYGEGDAEDIVKEAAKDLASWFYDQLEKEDEHLSSDEVVDETLAINDYTFTEDGQREDV